MTVYETIKQHEELLKSLQTVSVSVDDIRHIEMYEEYLRLNKDGLKVRYIVAYLREKYAVGEATIWRILRRFKATV